MLSAAGLAVGLALGGALILFLLQERLIHSVDANSRQVASDVATLVSSGDLPKPIASAGGVQVQVLDENRQIIGASEGIERYGPLVTAAEEKRAVAGHVVVIPASRMGEDGRFRVSVTRTTDGHGHPRMVVVSASMHAADESLETVAEFLIVVYPLLVCGLSALAWRVVTSALRPVEALRVGADQISAGDRSVASLPVPDGDDEVHRLAVTLNDMLGRLDAGRARQRAFVADAAHELRSPIASLRTQIEVAEHMKEAPVTLDLLADLSRLNRLVDDLLLLARADEGDPRLRAVEAVDLVALARTTVDGYAYGNARVGVTLIAKHPVGTLGEPIALRRVLDNLITNAVRHASSGVEVEVAPYDSEQVRVTVTDDGPGIPAADRERVFDRFTRLDNARDRDQGGAGLGLPIVAELLRLHHGSITLTDAEPGLRVTVLLPAAIPPG
jgi:signal transduction histidine kinase